MFLAANPSGTDHVALDEEARAIRAALERGRYRRRFRFVTRWAVESTELLRELHRLKPAIVHFSGHGVRTPASETPCAGAPCRDVVDPAGLLDGEQRQGLLFQGLDHRPQFVSLTALKQAFQAAGSSVRLLVLNACHSGAPADALPDVDCIVGMTGSIQDEAATRFAASFYASLAERASVAAAYATGRAAIAMVGLHDGDRPRLTVRDGVDATQIVFAQDVARPSRDFLRGLPPRRKWIAGGLVALSLAGVALLLTDHVRGNGSTPSTGLQTRPLLDATVVPPPPPPKIAPPPPPPFEVVIRTHGPRGDTDRGCVDGTVVVSLGSDHRVATISPEGEARLAVDAQDDGTQVWATVKCRGFVDNTTTIALHRGQPAHVAMARPPRPPPPPRTCSWTSSRGVFEGRGDSCGPLGPTSENLTHYNAITDYESRTGHVCSVKLDCK